MPDTLGSLEMQLFQDRPDLWGITMALKHAPGYKPEMWSIISDSDKEILKAHAAKIRAVNARIQASKE